MPPDNSVVRVVRVVRTSADLIESGDLVDDHPPQCVQDALLGRVEDHAAPFAAWCDGRHAAAPGPRRGTRGAHALQRSGPTQKHGSPLQDSTQARSSVQPQTRQRTARPGRRPRAGSAPDPPPIGVRPRAGDRLASVTP